MLSQRALLRSNALGGTTEAGYSYGAIARLSLPVQTTAAVAFTPESARIVVPIAAHISELRNVISYLRRPVGIRAQSLVKTAP